MLSICYSWSWLFKFFALVLNIHGSRIYIVSLTENTIPVSPVCSLNNTLGVYKTSKSFFSKLLTVRYRNVLHYGSLVKNLYWKLINQRIYVRHWLMLNSEIDFHPFSTVLFQFLSFLNTIYEYIIYPVFLNSNANYFTPFTFHLLNWCVNCRTTCPNSWTVRVK